MATVTNSKCRLYGDQENDYQFNKFRDDHKEHHDINSELPVNKSFTFSDRLYKEAIAFQNVDSI